jgi:hypothetical protein
MLIIHRYLTARPDSLCAAWSPPGSIVFEVFLAASPPHASFRNEVAAFLCWIAYRDSFYARLPRESTKSTAAPLAEACVDRGLLLPPQLVCRWFFDVVQEEYLNRRGLRLQL